MQLSAGFFIVLAAALVLGVSGCATNVPPSDVKSNAKLTPSTAITRDLTHLPRPKSRIPVAVYAFRDQTGQYKTAPDSAYSTLVTQGAASMLVKALWDSGWYVPVEREGLQNLLTERRVIRATENPAAKGVPLYNLPNMMPASMIIEGGVIAYESNVRSGGKGANYLGLGASTQYRVDQVTVSLRSVDVRYGQIMNAVSVTKTIYSYQLNASVYKYVAYQTLLQAETGYATNEPGQLAVREAIEAAVIHLTVNGIRDRNFELEDNSQWFSPVVQAYLTEEMNNISGEPLDESMQIPMRPVIASREPVVPLPYLEEQRQPGGVVSRPAVAPAAATPVAAPASQPAPSPAPAATPAAIAPAATPAVTAAAAMPAAAPASAQTGTAASKSAVAPAQAGSATERSPAKTPAKPATPAGTAVQAKGPGPAASSPAPTPALAPAPSAPPADRAPVAASSSPAQAPAAATPLSTPASTPAAVAAPRQQAAAAPPAAPRGPSAPASAAPSKPASDIFDLYWNKR